MRPVKRYRCLKVSDLANALREIRSINIMLIPNHSPLFRPLDDIIELCDDTLNADPDQHDYSGDGILIELFDDDDDDDQ